jgi:hypothetical protein
MSWPAITGSTPVPSRSNARCASAHLRALTISLYIWSATCPSMSNSHNCRQMALVSRRGKLSVFFYASHHFCTSYFSLFFLSISLIFLFTNFNTNIFSAFSVYQNVCIKYLFDTEFEQVMILWLCLPVTQNVTKSIFAICSYIFAKISQNFIVE